jgi:flavorubredoxin
MVGEDANYKFRLEQQNGHLYSLVPLNKTGNNKLFNQIFEDPSHVKVYRIDPHEMIEDYCGFKIETPNRKALLIYGDGYGIVKSADLGSATVFGHVGNEFEVKILDAPYSEAKNIAEYLSDWGLLQHIEINNKF